MSVDGPHVVVVGAGITGLAAAYFLRRLMAQRLPSGRITVVEANAYGGGKVRSTLHDACVLEHGPDGFRGSPGPALQLIAALGLNEQLVRSQRAPGYIWLGGRLCRIPTGTRMGVPTRVLPILRSQLLSSAGKWQAVRGMLRQPPEPLCPDESVGHFYRRQFGNDLVDHLLDPLLSTVYGGDIDHYSVRALFSHGAAASTPRPTDHGDSCIAAPPISATHSHGQFLTLRFGLGALVTRLEEHLHRLQFLRRTPLTAIHRLSSGYRLELANAAVATDADAIILAIPASAAAAALPSARAWFEPMLETPPTSAVVINLVFAATQLRVKAAGTGFLVPRAAGTSISACTFMHRKWPHAAPPGAALLRCFLNRRDVLQQLTQPDAVLVANVLRELRALIPLQGPPRFYQVTRWPQAMPQYAVGHSASVVRLRAELANSHPGVVLAGAAYDGIGVADCIRQGQVAAVTVIDHLTRAVTPRPLTLQGPASC